LRQSTATLNIEYLAAAAGSERMQERVRRIEKAGTWRYDGQVKGYVRVVCTNYFEHEYPPDEYDDPDYPPRDDDGNFYFVEYWVEGGGASVSRCFGSAEEAVRRATEVVSPIVWD
jgi:hypothetical protein